MDRAFTDNKLEGLQSPSFPLTIAEWPKGKDTVRVSLSEFNKRRCVDLRIWYRANDDTIKPSPKGLTLQVDALPALAAAIDEALAKAVALGLVREGGNDD